MHLMALAADIDWGDAPTWAGVTLAAAAGTIGLLLYRVESKRDRKAAAAQQKRDELERQQQAAQVCAWFGSRDSSALLASDPDWGIWIRNGSQLPIYDASFEINSTDTENPLEHRHVYSLAIVPPGEAFLTEPLRGLQILDHQWSYEVELIFRDAANGEWHRAKDGVLREHVGGVRAMLGRGSSTLIGLGEAAPCPREP